MTWIFMIVLLALNLWTGFRREQRAGLWSWSLFFFALSFAGLEWIILWVPLSHIPMGSRWYGFGITASVILALGNFVWFILICRRWPLPGRGA